MIELDTVDRALIGGEFGEASAHAMRLLVRYGNAARARRFISVKSAHIDGCLYHGPSSIDFARRFVELGGRVRIPTTLNVAAVDVVHPELHCGDPGLLDAQRELTRLHEALGCLPTLTCAPYQRIFHPLPGQHVAWAESNAIVFVNSVLGARTDRYGDFTDLCAALTGRVPEAGLHCEENRVPQLILDLPPVAAAGLPRDLYFAAIGYVVGRRAAGRVPLLRGLPKDATKDELKALGAAAASSGSLALFHAAGVTPEHDWAAARAATIVPAAIGVDALEAAIRQLCPVEIDEPVSAVCLGTPHYSMAEFVQLSKAVDGRTPAPGVAIFVSTSREIAAALSDDPAAVALRRFGVEIVVDTCTYLAPVVRNSTAVILTSSAKYAHYGPGNLQRRIGLMTLDRCIRSAVLGRVAAA